MPLPAKKTAAKKVAAPTKKTVAKAVAPPAKKAGAPVKKGVPRAPSGGKPPQIMPLSQGIDTTGRPSILLYGPPGTGKTVLACSGERTLLLEADRGELSAVMRGLQADKWPINDWDDLGEALSYLKRGGFEEYDWVVLDTITIFQQRGLDHIMEDLVAAKPNRQLWQPDKGEYGQNMNRMLRWLRDFTNLPTGRIVTAHLLVEDDHTGESRYMPYIQGKAMPDKVCSFFDMVGHMSMKTVEGKEIPRVSFHQEDKFYAKDRAGVGAMVDPTIPKIMRRIEKARQG